MGLAGQTNYTLDETNSCNPCTFAFTYIVYILCTLSVMSRVYNNREACDFPHTFNATYYSDVQYSLLYYYIYTLGDVYNVHVLVHNVLIHVYIILLITSVGPPPPNILNSAHCSTHPG